MSLELFLQNISNGIALGGMYALIAIGYTMVYGVLRLINFAHSSIFTVGAYIAFTFIAMFHMNWAIAYVAAIVLTALLGRLTEVVAYRPLRDAPRISALISAISVSFILENLLVMIYGGRPKSFPRPEFFNNVVMIGTISMPVANICIIVATVFFLSILLLILYRTKSGRAMRAMSMDFDTARLMGVDVDKVVGLTFVIGSALAAVAGFLVAGKYPQINPYMAAVYGNKAFVAAVFGGIGSVEGAAIGGVLIGLIEIMFVAFFPNLSGYRDAIAFLILIVVLLYMPNGIMHTKGKVKV